MDMPTAASGTELSSPTTSSRSIPGERNDRTQQKENPAGRFQAQEALERAEYSAEERRTATYETRPAPLPAFTINSWIGHARILRLAANRTGGGPTTVDPAADGAAPLNYVIYAR
jgi:hypothetical protein